MRTVGVIGGVGDCEGASKCISKVVKAPVKEFQQYVQVKSQKQNTKSRKEIWPRRRTPHHRASRMVGSSLPLPESNVVASARNLVVVFLPWKAWGKSVSASWRRHCYARSQVELHLGWVLSITSIFFQAFFNYLRRLTCSVCCCVVINLDWDNISISRSILVLIIAYLVIDCRICHFSSNSETTCALFVFCAIFLQSELGLRGIWGRNIERADAISSHRRLQSLSYKCLFSQVSDISPMMKKYEWEMQIGPKFGVESG